MEELKPDVRVDVSQDTAFTKESALARMDKLLEMGAINLKQWAQLLPQNSPLPKAELLRLIDEREAEEQAMMDQQGMGEEAPAEEPMTEGVPNGLPQMQ